MDPPPCQAYPYHEQLENGLERPRGRWDENLGHFSSLVGVVVIARKLTYGNSVAIPAIAETKNTRHIREDSWLPFLDTYRTMCLAQQPDFRRVLAGVLAMELAA